MDWENQLKIDIKAPSVNRAYGMSGSSGGGGGKNSLSSGDLDGKDRMSAQEFRQNIGKSKSKGGGKPKMYKKKKVTDYQEVIELAVKNKLIADQHPKPFPLRLGFKFGFKRQIRDIKQMHGHPLRDLNNPVKHTEDALEGILFKDDKQVIEAWQKKVLSDDPFVEILWSFAPEYRRVD